MTDYVFIMAHMSRILKKRGDEQLLTRLLNSNSLIHVAAADFVGSDYLRSIKN